MEQNKTTNYIIKNIRMEAKQGKTDQEGEKSFKTNGLEPVVSFQYDVTALGIPTVLNEYGLSYLNGK